MEYLKQRKAIRQGHSICVSLPPDWVKVQGIDPGTYLTVGLDNGKLVLEKVNE